MDAKHGSPGVEVTTARRLAGVMPVPDHLHNVGVEKGMIDKPIINGAAK